MNDRKTAKDDQAGKDLEKERAQDGGLAGVRALVREVIAEELERFWERRFGGRP
jgi:hypothetical protein